MTTNKKKVYVVYCDWHGDCLGVYSSIANCMKAVINIVEDMQNDGACSRDFRIERNGRYIYAVELDGNNLLLEYWYEEKYLDEDV